MKKARDISWISNPKRSLLTIAVVIACALSLVGCSGAQSFTGQVVETAEAKIIVSQGASGELSAPDVSLDDIPEYDGESTVELNGGKPYFDESDFGGEGYEEYSSLDSEGRCGVCEAVVGTETMPTEKRGEIGMVKPTGWHTVRYDWVDGKYLYNRCHLIGYQLTGENANTKNLITGTRSMNVEGMEPYENEVADYVRDTGNHVLYRVTPLFEGDDLVAEGVVMEAQSVEDNGDGVEFCVFCYNEEPGVEIDYATGDNWADGTIEGDGSSGSSGTTSGSSSSKGGSSSSSSSGSSNDSSISSSSSESSGDTSATCNYILNTNSMKFHKPSCDSVKKMSDHNKKEFTGTRDEVIAEGYSPCGACKP